MREPPTPFDAPSPATPAGAPPPRRPTLPWIWIVHGSLLAVTSWEGCWHLSEGPGYAGLYKLIPLGAIFVALFGLAMGFLMGRGARRAVAVRAIAGVGGLAASLLALLVFPFTGMYLGNLIDQGMAASAVVYLASPALYLGTLVAVRRATPPAPFLPALGVSALLFIGGHFVLRDAVPGSREGRLRDEQRDALGLRITAAVEHEDAAALAAPEMWEQAAKHPFEVPRYNGSGGPENALELAIDLKRPGAVRVLLEHKPQDYDPQVERALWIGDEGTLDVYSQRGLIRDKLAEGDWILRDALRAEGAGGVLFLAAHDVGADRLLCVASAPSEDPTVQRDLLRHEKELLAHGAHGNALCRDGEDGGSSTLEARLAAAHAAIARLPAAPQ